MKRVAIIALLLATILNGNDAEYQSVREGDNQFSIKFYQALATASKARDKNIFFSPFSLNNTFSKGVTRGNIIKSY